MKPGITPEQVKAQIATAATELRVLAGMLGADNLFGMWAKEIALYLMNKRDRWDDNGD